MAKRQRKTRLCEWMADRRLRAFAKWEKLLRFSRDRKLWRAMIDYVGKGPLVWSQRYFLCCFLFLKWSTHDSWTNPGLTFGLFLNIFFFCKYHFLETTLIKLISLILSSLLALFSCYLYHSYYLYIVVKFTITHKMAAVFSNQRHWEQWLRNKKEINR